jgi:hypothetical protein
MQIFRQLNMAIVIQELTESPANLSIMAQLRN